MYLSLGNHRLLNLLPADGDVGVGLEKLQSDQRGVGGVFPLYILHNQPIMSSFACVRVWVLIKKCYAWICTPRSCY